MTTLLATTWEALDDVQSVPIPTSVSSSFPPADDDDKGVKGFSKLLLCLPTGRGKLWMALDSTQALVRGLGLPAPNRYYKALRPGEWSFFKNLTQIWLHCMISGELADVESRVAEIRCLQESMQRKDEYAVARSVAGTHWLIHNRHVLFYSGAN